MKVCPYCAEEIQDAAIVCEHCGRELESAIRFGDRKKCPHCAEWIHKEAKVCRYCGRDVVPIAPPEELGEPFDDEDDDDEWPEPLHFEPYDKPGDKDLFPDKIITTTITITDPIARQDIVPRLKFGDNVDVGFEVKETLPLRLRVRKGRNTDEEVSRKMEAYRAKHDDWYERFKKGETKHITESVVLGFLDDTLTNEIGPTILRFTFRPSDELTAEIISIDRNPDAITIKFRLPNKHDKTNSAHEWDANFYAFPF